VAEFGRRAAVGQPITDGLKDKAWEKKMREEVLKQVESEGIVPLYTRAEIQKKEKKRDKQPAWTNDGIKRFNELSMMVTIDRLTDQKEEENSTEAWLKSKWNEKKAPGKRGKKRKQGPLDESGNWQGSRTAKNISCINLEDVKDIATAKQRMKEFLEQKDHGNFAGTLRQWAEV
jgi:hypothetical protein